MEKALEYLEISTQLEDSIYSTNVATELEKKTYRWNADAQVRKEQFKAKRRIYTIAMIAVVLLLVIVIIYQQILKNKKIQQSNYKYLLQKLKQNLMDMQQNIAQHEEVIAELKQKQRKPCRGNRREGTGYRGHEDGEGEIAQLVVPAKCLYTKIDKLANQQKHHKERIAVLTNAEQRQLRVIIGQIYADYIEQLHTRYPKLNEDDVLLLCLQLADLSPFAIALCFGNNDAQIVAQRKYRMKSKME